MRPLKSTLTFSKWLLRLSLVAIVYITSFDTFLSFAFNNFYYFVHLLMVLFGALLLAGGFTRRHTLTVLSSLFLLILFLADLYFKGTGSLYTIITHVTFASLAFFFLSSGNK